MSPSSLSPAESFYLPPSPTGDLRGMLRRHIVRTALAQLAEAARARATPRTAAEWRTYSAGVRRRFAAAVDRPELRRVFPWRVRQRGSVEQAGVRVENWLVESLPDCWMNVTVWKPDARRWAPPWPAVVTPVGHNGKYHPSEQFPPQVFAANGYLSVSFDPPGFGEKARGNDHFTDGVRGYVTGQNPLAFFLADALRAVDYVLARPDVQGGRGVAMTGVSGGGFSTVTCALLDARVRVLGPSCFGLPDEIHPVLNGYAGCPETLWRGRFAAGLGLADLLIGARFAPMLVMAGRRDTVLTARHLRQLIQPVRRAYAQVGRADRFAVLVDDCGHEYSVAQAKAFVGWMRRWGHAHGSAQAVVVPGRLPLLPEARLRGRPPFGTCMASAAAEAARIRSRVTDAAKARRELARLIPEFAAHRRRGLRVQARRGSRLQLWTHTLQELSLRDGADWELPATLVRPSRPDAPMLIFFDDRGRWASLEKGGWLNRAAGLFTTRKDSCAVLAVDLPGWGDTRPLPSPFDVVGWGGADRWTGYVSAATGESVMALRLRDAVRVVDLVRRRWSIPSDRVVLGGRGLGATIAGLAACLHGGVGGALLLEPLAEFADLAQAPRPSWPHDAYFPGILAAADLPEALALQPGPVLVVGPRDAQGKRLGRAARKRFPGRRIDVEPTGFTASMEARVLAWLKDR